MQAISFNFSNMSEHPMQKRAGRITVIHGPMFSGKTEELLRRIRRARVARKKTQLFKPRKDARYHLEKVVPHYLAHQDHEQFGEKAIAVDSPLDIEAKLLPDVNLVGIEEGQFFDYSLFYLLKNISRQGIDVVISLLDQDFRRMPFPIENSNKTVGDYLALAHESIKLSAICVKCGADAQYSQKLVYAGEYSRGNSIYVPASFF